MDFRQCVICLDQCTTGKSPCVGIGGKKGEVEAVRNNLNVMFVLQHVLNMPQVQMKMFLEKHGNPTDWDVHVCSSCNDNYILSVDLDSILQSILNSNVENRAQMLQEEKSKIEFRFQVLRTHVSEHIQTSHTNQPADLQAKPKPRGKRKNKTCPSPVFTKVREWIIENCKPSQNGTDTDLEKLVAAAGGVDNYAAQLAAQKAFKTLGLGRKLVDDPQPGPSSSSNYVSVTVPRNQQAKVESMSGQDTLSVQPNCDPALAPKLASGVSQERKAAAAAALVRLEKAKKPAADSKELLAARQAAYIKEQAQRELDAETRAEADMRAQKNSNVNSGFCSSSTEIVQKVIDPGSYAVQGVFYSCPLIGSQVLTKQEIDVKIKEFLLKQLKDDEEVTSCLLIHSCNTPQEKVNLCVTTLCTYLDKIIQNPTETKFHQIRCSNRYYQENVAGIIGAEQFLIVAGFRKYELPNKDTWDQREEDYWVFEPDEESPFASDLINLRDMLKSTVPIKAELDRNVQLLRPQQVQTKTELPDEFYTLNPEEIKREQQLKTDKVERELTLRTKAMRERDEIAERRVYRFGIMRIRFSDSVVLQGTFGESENLSSLFEFVKENLVSPDLNFGLIKPGVGRENLKTAKMNSTLSELNLLPSSILIFQPETVLAEQKSYLKPELLVHLNNNF